MVQIFLAIMIIAIGFYCFYFFPFKKGDVRSLVVAAIFVILTAICKRLAIMVPLFGAESLKIGFEYIPLMLAGFYLSPSYAFVVGFSSDMIGLILVPTGFPFLGFTLGTILVSVIPSLVKEYVKNIKSKHVEKMTMGLITMLGIGASIYVYQLQQISISDTMYQLTIGNKITIISICLILVVIFNTLIILLKKRFSDDEAKFLSMWMLSVVLVELIVTLCLTPLWLDIMYKIPFVVSMCIRIIKECLILPIEIFVGYILIKILNRILKN